jgi:glycine C-acetyltransferase
VYDPLKPRIETELASIRDAGLYKDERVLASPQGAEVTLATGARCWCSAPTTISGSRATRT